MKGLLILNILLTVFNAVLIISCTGTIVKNQKFWGEKKDKETKK